MAVDARTGSWARGRRNPRFRFVPLLIGTLWALLGCGGSPESLDSADAGSGVPDGVFPDTRATSVEFVPGGELALVAGQTAELTVQVLPAGVHTVRFALLGDTDDAFLSASVKETDADGRVEASLTALGAATTFTVRAAAGRASGTLEVITQEASRATLLVNPKYPGTRPVSEWSASVHYGTTCANLTGVPFPDGEQLTTGRRPVTVEDVTAGVPVAVVVRARQFAGGCQGLSPLRANAVQRVDVDVSDLPMQTANLSLEVGFGVEATEMPNPALDELAFRAVSPLAGSASDDLAALLDAMSALSDDTAAFEAARAAQTWRTALVNGLAPNLPGTGLRTLVQNWMRSGIELLEVPGALRGTLTALAPGVAASLRLESVIGLAPEEAGFAAENTASAAAETDDFLQLGTTLQVLPSTLLAAAASQAALTRDPERTSPADAMATQFGCDDVASIITGVGSQPGEAFEGCDEGCALALCREAMGVLWARVADSALPAVPWQISGRARARIDDDARPRQVGGTWIGTLTVPNFGTTPIQGPFTGESSP
ncbi:MAG TPA: hypothetical protein VMG12_13735 [Polyangiaceae bacterium]|nr:hypothetical protein [Polyangiaceae bacterium]